MCLRNTTETARDGDEADRTDVWLMGDGGDIRRDSGHREGYYLAETNTYHENISNSKTACVRTERQQVGTK